MKEKKEHKEEFLREEIYSYLSLFSSYFSSFVTFVNFVPLW